MAASDFVCVERFPPEDKVDTAIRDALAENPANAIHSLGIFGENKAGPVPSSLTINITKFWANGRSLKVKFLRGNKTLHDKVKKHAATWEKYANIFFEFVPEGYTGDTDIRIDFEPGDGHYSYLGTDNLTIPQTEKTLNLDVLDASDDEIARTALHELGHAIGCEHEHQSPKAKFKWRKAVVYADMAKPPNRWTKEMVDHNILNRLDPEQVTATDFDPTSIMCYGFKATWFEPGSGVPTNRNIRLSQRDRDFIGTVYPADPSDVGHFSTLQLRPADPPGFGSDTTMVDFTPVYPEPPRLALGLTWLDLQATQDLSVRATADGIERDHFTVGIVSKTPPSLVRSAAASWLEVAATETDIQLGSLDFTSAGTKGVNFPMSFDDATPPKVVAWLSGFELGRAGRWVINVAASEANQYGFKVALAAPGADLQTATVSWAAFPANKPNICAGVFSTDNVPGLDNNGEESFADDSGAPGKSPFAKPPQLFTAIGAFNFPNPAQLDPATVDDPRERFDLRLRLATSIVTATGFKWNFDSWYTSVLGNASAAYIAVLPSKHDKA